MNEHSSGVCSIRRKHVGLNSTWDLKNKGLNPCVQVSPLSLTREPVNHCICSLFLATVIIVGPTEHCLSLQSMCLCSPHLPKRLLQPCCSTLADRRLFQSVTVFYFNDKSKPEVFISQSREWLPLLYRLWMGVAHLGWQKWQDSCSCSLNFWVVKQPKRVDCKAYHLVGVRWWDLVWARILG